MISSGASALARDLAHRLGASAVSTLMALGAIPANDPLPMGMLGMHAGQGTHQLLEEADILFAIGARFDDRATGKVAEFCPRATIVHLDIDPVEIGKIKQPFLGLVSDAGEVLRRLLDRLRPQTCSDWSARAVALRREYTLDYLPVAQAWPFRQPRTLLTSGGLGTMGFGLPAAIGAALVAPGRRIVCVSGDGSILMNIQELPTLAVLDLPVAVLIYNNGHLGLVRQQQELFYDEHYSASRFQAVPDFAAVASAFGVSGVRIDPVGDPLAAITAALSKPGPCVIDIPINETTNVFPMVPPGAANRQTITARPAVLACN